MLLKPKLSDSVSEAKELKWICVWHENAFYIVNPVNGFYSVEKSFELVSVNDSRAGSRSWTCHSYCDRKRCSLARSLDRSISSLVHYLLFVKMEFSLHIWWKWLMRYGFDVKRPSQTCVCVCIRCLLFRLKSRSNPICRARTTTVYWFAEALTKFGLA